MVSTKDRNRHLLFAALALLPVLLFAAQFMRLWTNAVMLADVTHFFVVIPACCAMMYLHRRAIFDNVQPNRVFLVILVFSAIILAGASRTIRSSANQDNYVPLVLFSIVWVNIAFIAVYGIAAFKPARFPLLFLFSASPIPAVLDTPFQNFLQNGTAMFAETLFRLSHTPVLRSDLILRLSWGDLEVARECSGIRATILLLLIAAVAGKFHLKRVWSRIALFAAAILIAIGRNGLRIFTLCWIRQNVDPNVFEGPIHQHAGVPFFLLSLLLLFVVLRSLGWTETLFADYSSESANPKLANPHPRSSPGW